jgi:hypothetical protein
VLLASDAKSAPTGVLRLSPIFFIPADRAALMQRYRSAISGSTSDAPAATAAQTPFLDAP